MNKDKFLELKSLFEEYQICKESLEELQNSKDMLIKESRVTKLFTVEIGTFQTKMDADKGVNVEEIKPAVLDLIKRMTSYYEQRIAEIDQIIEQA